MAYLSRNERFITAADDVRYHKVQDIFSNMANIVCIQHIGCVKQLWFMQQHICLVLFKTFTQTTYRTFHDLFNFDLTDRWVTFDIVLIKYPSDSSTFHRFQSGNVASGSMFNAKTFDSDSTMTFSWKEMEFLSSLVEEFHLSRQDRYIAIRF